MSNCQLCGTRVAQGNRHRRGGCATKAPLVCHAPHIPSTAPTEIHDLRGQPVHGSGRNSQERKHKKKEAAARSLLRTKALSAAAPFGQLSGRRTFLYTHQRGRRAISVGPYKRPDMFADG